MLNNPQNHVRHCVSDVISTLCRKAPAPPDLVSGGVSFFGAQRDGGLGTVFFDGLVKRGSLRGRRIGDGDECAKSLVATRPPSKSVLEVAYCHLLVHGALRTCLEGATLRDDVMKSLTSSSGKALRY